MEKLLKKGSRGVVVGLYSMEVKKEDENNTKELKCTLEKHHKVFQEIPKGLPPSRYHERQIELTPRSIPPNKRLYRYPHWQKGEIQKMVQHMLDLVVFSQVGVHFIS
jgi:hypothetical protein